MQNTLLTDKFIKKAYPTKLYPLKANIVGPHHPGPGTLFLGYHASVRGMHRSLMTALSWMLKTKQNQNEDMNNYKLSL